DGAARTTYRQTVRVGDPKLIFVDGASHEARRPRSDSVPRAHARGGSPSVGGPEDRSLLIADVQGPVANGGRVARVEGEYRRLPKAIAVEAHHVVQPDGREARFDGTEANGHPVHDEGGTERVSGDDHASSQLFGHERHAAH